jgi:hypothetical protein
MEKMKNIDRFNLLTGLIFALAYESFPIAQNVNCVGFLTNEYKKAIERSGGVYEEQIDRRDALVLSETFFWLRDAGFISFLHPPRKTIAGGNIAPSEEFLGLTLTAKGLETLKRAPKSISGAKTIGEAFASAVKEVTLESVKSLVSEAFSVGASILVKWSD